VSSSFDPTNLFLIFTGRLEALGLRYMITGSVASTLYGEPRLTHDVDLVLDLDVPSITRLAAAFPLQEFYCAPEEIILLEAQRRQRGSFNIIHHDSGFKCDVYLAGRDPLHRWALERRRPIDVGASVVWVAPPEYVVVRKLEYFREGGSQKHIDDIRGLIRLTVLDRDELQRWIRSLGLTDAWASVGA